MAMPTCITWACQENAQQLQLKRNARYNLSFLSFPLLIVTALTPITPVASTHPLYCVQCHTPLLGRLEWCAPLPNLQPPKLCSALQSVFRPPNSVQPSHTWCGALLLLGWLCGCCGILVGGHGLVFFLEGCNVRLDAVLFKEGERHALAHHSHLNAQA
eukprot:38001-Pelagomonas_calceolata.AAC.2